MLFALFNFFRIFSSQILCLKYTHFFLMVFWDFREKNCWFITFAGKILLLLDYSCYSSLWRRSILIMLIKNHKYLVNTIKYLVNCCVLTWFILFWINERGTLLLQFINYLFIYYYYLLIIYMLFKMLAASYWYLGPPSGRDCRKSIFTWNELLVGKGAHCLVHSRRAAEAHGHGLVLV